jgi:hypothetical protein
MRLRFNDQSSQYAPVAPCFQPTAVKYCGGGFIHESSASGVRPARLAIIHFHLRTPGDDQ